MFENNIKCKVSTLNIIISLNIAASSDHWGSKQNVWCSQVSKFELKRFLRYWGDAVNKELGREKQKKKIKEQWGWEEDCQIDVRGETLTFKKNLFNISLTQSTLHQ